MVSCDGRGGTPFVRVQAAQHRRRHRVTVSFLQRPERRGHPQINPPHPRTHPARISPRGCVQQEAVRVGHTPVPRSGPHRWGDRAVRATTNGCRRSQLEAHSSAVCSTARARASASSASWCAVSSSVLTVLRSCSDAASPPPPTSRPSNGIPRRVAARVGRVQPAPEPATSSRCLRCTCNPRAEPKVLSALQRTHMRCVLCMVFVDALRRTTQCQAIG